MHHAQARRLHDHVARRVLRRARRERHGPADGRFFDEYNLERQRTADTLPLGATTYRGFKGYWPAVAENPSVSPAVVDNPDVADLHRETGQRNNELHKVVVSDSLTEADTAPWTDTTTIRATCRCAPGRRRTQGQARPGHPGVREPDPVERPAGRRLVDELHVMVGAGVLGGGTPAFGAGPAAAAGEHRAPGRLGQPAAPVRLQVCSACYTHGGFGCPGLRW
jgi:dihydrofolate reductase